MLKLLRALALAVTLSLTASVANAEPQLALVQRTFDALRQSSAALDQGDVGKAQTLLAGIRSSAETLRGNAERFAIQAAETEKLREAEARQTTELITSTAQAEQAADKDVRDLEPKIADLTAQLNKANETRTALENQLAVYQQEAKIRNECKAHFADGIFWSGDCWRLGWEDLVSRQWERLNNDIRDNSRQRVDIENARRGLSEQLNAQQRKLRETKARKAQLEAQRRELDQRVTTLKAAVVSLTDATLFWRDTATLIGSRITSIGTLQESLQLLAKRARGTSTAPVFDSYEKEEVRSLEATLIDFARTLDNGTNILLSRR